MQRHPILSRIDEAQNDGSPPLASAHNADALERIAASLTDEYWSENAWLTGNVPPAAFEHVCKQLDMLRRASSHLMPSRNRLRAEGTAATSGSQDDPLRPIKVP